MIADPPPTSPDEITSIHEYQRHKLAALRRVPAVRTEVGLTVGMLALLFALPLASWWQRWTLPGSPQFYAIFVLPLILVWLWIHRYRLAVPELDSLHQRFTERAVLQFLLEEDPEPPKRLRWPLWYGCLLTVFALWMGEPTFTAIAFALLMFGIVAFRQGTLVARVVSFPLLLLWTLIPFPPLGFDTFFWLAQLALMKFSSHLLQIVGVHAELAVEGNPLLIPPDNPTYMMFAGQVGVGFAEAGLFLLLTLGWLSLVAAPFRAKFGSVICAVVWIVTLMTLRLTLIGGVGSFDADLAPPFALLTRILLPIAGLAGQWFIFRLLRCRTLHEYVREGLHRDSTPLSAATLRLRLAASRYRIFFLRLLGATTVLGVGALVTAASIEASHKPPFPPAQIEGWQSGPAEPPKGDAQRGAPPAIYRVYTRADESPIYVSIARARTLNALRIPYRYLLDRDGMMVQNQEDLVARKGERLPSHLLQIGRDHNDDIMIMHWAQAPGSKPIPDALDDPGRIATTLTTHSPYYICDIWTILRPGTNGEEVEKTLMRFADLLDAQIKAQH